MTAVARVEALPPGFPALRDMALAEGWRLLRVLEEDWDARRIRFDGIGEGLFAAWRKGALAGLAGLTADPYADSPGMARLYVGPAHRGHGLGRALVRAAADAAGAQGFAAIRVRSPAAAAPFYEACGFLPAVLRSATHVLPM